MRSRNRIILLGSAALLEVAIPMGSADISIAADNAIQVSPGSGPVMRTKDVGSGVQSTIQILGDLAGNGLYISNASSALATGSTNVPAISFLYGWNGATWDQVKTAAGIMQVGGTLNVGNFPAIQTVSGTVTQGGAPWVVSGTITQGGSPWTVAGTVNVGNFPAIQTISGTVTQGGAPWTMAGTVSIANFPAIQTISGTVTQGGAPWVVSGTVNIGTMPNPVTVSGTIQIGNFPAIQTVSGTVTQGGAPWTVAGTGGSGAMNINCLSGCGGSISVGNVGIVTWASGTLGPMSTFGGTVGSILVPSFNAWVVGGTVSVGNTNNNGQATGSASSPVVLASDQKVGDPCTYQAKLTIDFVGAASGTAVILGVTGSRTYICSVGALTSGSANLGLFEAGANGTGCAAGTIGSVLFSNGTGASSGAFLLQGAGYAWGAGVGTIANTKTTGNNVCVAFTTTNSPQVNLHFSYIIQ